jgi:hypothetical protein
VIDANDLVGVWSAGAGYYDTFSDERVVFKPDGTGRVAFLNPYSDTSFQFHWQIVSFGVLELLGGGPLTKPGVSFSISEEERPTGTGQRMLVLRIDLPELYPCELGLLSRDWASFETAQ